MTPERTPSVLAALPRTRPHRRSDKRPAVARSVEASAAAGANAQRTPARPPAARAKPAAAKPVTDHPGPLGTAVQAAAELTEIGLKASARALRGALARLPRH